MAPEIGPFRYALIRPVAGSASGALAADLHAFGPVAGSRYGTTKVRFVPDRRSLRACP